ncbi:MAG: radical SAM protein [Candidatus Altiarchaeales archaeon]|nr:radical SAM protein [Candidatus Altiarchaeales archaeon]
MNSGDVSLGEVPKINLLLLNPPAEERYVKESRCQHRAAVFQSVYPPLTLAYIASLTRGDNNVLLLDCMGEEITVGDLEDKVKQFNPDLVVVNTTTPTIQNDLEVIAGLKSSTDALFAVFGVHATRFARELITLPQIDIVIKGEPEITASELTEKKPENVDGILYKNTSGGIVENPDRGFLDPDSLPFPAWDMIDLKKYRMPVTGKNYVLLMTGRGCPYNCSFCVSTSYYGKKFRCRSKESVIKEIEYVKEMGIDNFFFFVETFTLNKKFVVDLCDEIMQRDLQIKWICNSRVDTVEWRMLKKMKQAGCWLMSFGIESGQQEILDGVNKGAEVWQSIDAVKMAYDAGIATIGHFIFGLPGETENSLEKTLLFSKKLPLNFAEFYIAVPFPGSELFEDLGLESHRDVDWSQFEYSHNSSGKGFDLENIRRRAYREFYLRPSLILRDIRLFGISNIPKLAVGGIQFLRNI